VALKLLRSVHLSTQKLLHHIGFGVVLLRMLTPKDLSIVIVKVTCIVSLKYKIIFNITSTYITSVICGNVGFLAEAIALEVAYSMTTVTLNIGGVAG
jgi:ribosomal protein S27E